MPRLRAVWASADQPAAQLPPESNERHRPGRAERLGAVHEATEAVHAATEAVHAARQRYDEGPGAARPEDEHVHGRSASEPVHDDPVHNDERVHASVHGGGTRGGQAEPADGVAHSLRDLLIALDLTTHYDYPELGDAARLFDRAARTPRAVLPDRWSEEARHLRAAAWRLSAVKALSARGAGREPFAALVAAIAALAAEVAAYQATKQRLAQTRAAHRCAGVLVVASERQSVSTRFDIRSLREARAPVARRGSSPPPNAERPAPSPRPALFDTSGHKGPRRPGSSRGR